MGGESRRVGEEVINTKDVWKTHLKTYYFLSFTCVFFIIIKV